nr:IAA30 [Galium aparine]
MAAIYENGLNLEATELRLGLPGTDTEMDQKLESSASAKSSGSKRSSSEMTSEKTAEQESAAPPSKAQVVGWPPVRNYRKNVFQQQKKAADSDGSGAFLKVSMDGAPYLRKLDLRVYKNYPELLQALQTMFKCKIGMYTEREGYNGSEFAPTYQDKDGDWMLVGDVPWEMFISSCRRLRIMKGVDAKGLGCS